MAGKLLTKRYTRDTVLCRNEYGCGLYGSPKFPSGLFAPREAKVLPPVGLGQSSPSTLLVLNCPKESFRRATSVYL